jgi:zinc transporter
MVADLGDSLDDCEEQITSGHAFELRRMVNARAVKAIGLRRFLNPQRAALEKLAATAERLAGDDDRLHLTAARIVPRAWPRSWRAFANVRRWSHETLTDFAPSRSTSAR